MRRWTNVLLLCFTLLGATVTAIGADDATGLDYFEKHIRPLLVEHCYQCHSASAESIEAGLRLDSRSAWAEGGDSGPAIVPGDPDASLLIQAVRYTDDGLQMPPKQRLPQESIARLEKWVQIGAPDPRDVEPAAAEGRRVSPSDPVLGREHWSFGPLSDQPPPPVDDADWPRSAIDHFVLARLESVGLRPSPDADPRVWVRRVYYQLTGLPPTAEQIRAYVDDHRPDAADRLVDCLLDSPQFGECWGRHWLDLARYSDSNGLDENFLFREAWRYRNWVIAAVNADLSFDRFLLAQIAGDLLPYESIAERDRQRIAAGFLVIGPKVLLGNDEKKQRLEIADEQIDTIGRAILGQTLGCARCHDHKFDPIPTADYYALAGILTSTTVMEQRYMLGEQRVMERLVGLGADGDRLDETYEEYWRNRPKLQAEVNRAKDVLERLKRNDVSELAAVIKDHPDALASGVADAAQPLEERLRSQEMLVSQLETRLANAPPIPERAMIPADLPSPSDERIRLAGQFDRFGQAVPRGFLQVLSTNTNSHRLTPEEQSGRIELGHWLTDVQSGAGQLAARVLANRIWYHLVGRGIVRTVDNFGRTGEAPTHPELLDYLAGRLVASGWSVKSLVREIVLSRTFGLSSDHEQAATAIDPENRLLWRANRRRLQPEALRDGMLAAAGLLDLAPMKSSVWYLGDQATGVGNNVRRRTDFHCRSVYLPVIRNDLPELFQVFDFADPHATTGARPQTTVAPQALYLLNDPLVMAAAEATARRLFHCESACDPEARVDRMYELVFGNGATHDERRAVLEFVEQMEQRLTTDGDAEPSLHAWTLACHALFGSSRFQFLD